MSLKTKRVVGSLVLFCGFLLPASTTSAEDLQCQDLSFLGKIYYAGLETYAEACKTECEVVDNVTKEKIATLDEFIQNCTSNKGTCDKNTLDQLIGINYCYMERLRNERQNTIATTANGNFDSKVQVMLQDNYTLVLNLSPLKDIVNYLVQNIKDQFNGHYQQIWNYICDTKELYEPVNATNCVEFKQKMLDIYNNNSDALTIAVELRNLLTKYENNGNLLTTCVNVACEKALEDLIFTQNTCHNYFVNAKNEFQNKKTDLKNVDVWSYFSSYTQKILEKKLLNTSYDVNKFADAFCGKLEEIRGEFGTTDLNTLLQDIEKKLVDEATNELCSTNENILLWTEY